MVLSVQFGSYQSARKLFPRSTAPDRKLELPKVQGHADLEKRLRETSNGRNLKSLFQFAKEFTNAVMELFGGQPLTESLKMICRSNGDDGEMLVS